MLISDGAALQEPGTKPSHVSRRMPSTASSPNGQSFALRIDVVSKSFESFEIDKFCGDSAEILIDSD